MTTRDDLKRQYQAAFLDMRRQFWRTGDQYHNARRQLVGLRLRLTAQGISHHQLTKWELEAMQEAQNDAG